ncbi:MAG: SGNH/GDSL hydrolase family protein [Hyphomicrobiales bacterium]|nr:SGNH/GDSL hydrolase family protein [Hyphomicrobiales bacterium]
MKLKLATALTWFGLPIYVWQGLGIRRKTIRPTPPFPQQVAPIAGKGTPFRLLLVGDSSAAGVGVDDIDASLGGQVPRLLAKQSGRPVEIDIIGSNSATAGQIRDNVIPHIKKRNFTHIIVNIGTNDAKNFHTVRRFYKDFGTLLYALNARFPRSNIIWSGIMDMKAIPALPFPLSNILGIRSRALMASGENLCRERLATIPDGEWIPRDKNFSEDGFHASAQGYHEWAQILVTHILRV